MSLRLVEPDEAPAPPPRRKHVPSGRPGEHHEPVRLAQDIAADLMHTAGVCGVPISLALAVLLEAELAVHAVLEAGGTPSLIGRHEDRAVCLSAAQSDYLACINRRPGGHGSGEWRPASSAVVVAIPVRLLPFCDETVLRTAVRRELAHALRWEEHAMRSGRTLTEWALRQALMAATAAARR